MVNLISYLILIRADRETNMVLCSQLKVEDLGLMILMDHLAFNFLTILTIETPWVIMRPY